MRGLSRRVVIAGAVVVASLLPAPLLAQTKTKPIDVIAKPAPPQEPRNQVTFNYEYENFNKDFTPWDWYSFEYGHRFDWGTLIGRVNQAHRYDLNDTQYEADAYVNLWKGAYLYLNFGVTSDDDFLPQRRYGAEIFFSLPKNFEMSGGMRRLEFENVDVNIFTGSVGYYSGNYYYAARPWVAVQPDDTSVSLSLLMRRYFATRNDYWTITVTGGGAADAGLTAEELLLSNQYTLTFEWQNEFARNWIFRAKAGGEIRDYDNGVDREGWIVGAGITRLF